MFSLLLIAVGALSSFANIGFNDKTSSLHKQCLFAFLTLSPFALITIGLYGNNDILPASSMVVALIGIVAHKKRLIRFLSGSVLAIGCLCKFYPLIILPSLCIRKRQIDWSFFSGFLGTFVLLTELAYAQWGSSILIPLKFAGSRDSKHLSIFNFIRHVLGFNIDYLSVYAMIVVFLVCIAFCILKDINPVSGAILTFAMVLSFYKVGHQQFFLFFFLVAPFALRYWISSLSKIFSRPIAGAFLAWLAYLNWYQLEYSITCGMWKWPAIVFRYWGAFFYAILSLVLLVIVFRSLSSKRAATD